MEDWLLTYLDEGLQGDLAGNQVAETLRAMVKSGNFKELNDTERLARIEKIQPHQNPILPYTEALRGTRRKKAAKVKPKATESDNRFLHLMLQNVKKFPGKENGEYYGLEFSVADEPKSCVFLGDNGVGKTSLYAALEFIGLHRMYTAEVRGYRRLINQSEYVTGKLELGQGEFLTHVGCTLGDARIEVRTVSGSMRWTGEDKHPRPLVVPAFYCSDYDVRELESKDDYTAYMVSQLGLSDLVDALNLLYRFCLEAQTKKWKTVAPKVVSEPIEEQLIIERAPSPAETERLEAIADEAKQLGKFLQNKLNALLCDWREGITKIIKDQLEPYFACDNDTVKVALDLPQFNWESGLKKFTKSRTETPDFCRFKIRIESAAGSIDDVDVKREEVDPRSYLNTFKYKLFCVTIKLALSLVAREIYGVNYPFVIDDVFDASDFNSRIGLKEYMREIGKRYKELAMEHGLYTPLQIIFFTQDDLIAGQVDEGLSQAFQPDNVKYCRIFDYHEVDEDKDRVVIETDDTSCSYLRISDDVKTISRN